MEIVSALQQQNKDTDRRLREHEEWLKANEARSRENEAAIHAVQLSVGEFRVSFRIVNRLLWVIIGLMLPGLADLVAWAIKTHLGYK
jgi:hypothetical protein